MEILQLDMLRRDYVRVWHVVLPKMILPMMKKMKQ